MKTSSNSVAPSLC